MKGNNFQLAKQKIMQLLETGQPPENLMKHLVPQDTTKDFLRSMVNKYELMRLEKELLEYQATAEAPETKQMIDNDLILIRDQLEYKDPTIKERERARLLKKRNKNAASKNKDE